MKKFLLAIIICIVSVPARAQYSASASGSTTAAAEINSKPAIQSAAAYASGNCTTGKDIWINTATGTVQWCKATNVWSDTNATCLDGATSGQYLYPGTLNGQNSGGTTSAFGSANRMSAYLVYIPCTWTPTKITIRQITGCAASGGEMAGLYTLAGSLIVSTGLITDATTVKCNTGSTTLTTTSGTSPAAVGLGTTRPPGYYWVAWVSKDTTGALGGQSAGANASTGFNANFVRIGFAAAGTADGSLPSTLPTLTSFDIVPVNILLEN